MSNLIEITEKAKVNIEKIFSTDENAKGKALRFSVIGGGCSGLSYKMDFDAIKEKDQILEFNSFKVVVDPKSSIYLRGIVVDYNDGLMDRGFKFINPNAKNTCGCGESFSV